MRRNLLAEQHLQHMPSSSFSSSSVSSDRRYTNGPDSTSLLTQTQQPSPQPSSTFTPSKLILPLTVIVAMTLFSLSSVLKPKTEATSTETGATSRSRTISPEQLSKTNEFAFKLFGETAISQKDVVISPLSLSSSLSLAHLGASPNSQAHVEFSSVIGAESHTVSSESLAKDVTLSIANSVWMKQNLLDTYINNVNKVSTIKPTIRQFPFTAKDVNTWVKTSTNGQIKEILNEPISKDLVALLINAVYLKAPWTTRFSKADTVNKPFKNMDDNIKSIPMMALRDQRFPYTYTTIKDDKEIRIVQLPYGNDKTYAATFIVPVNKVKATETLEQIIAKLQIAPSTFAKWLGSLKDTKIDSLQLPKFQMEFGVMSVKPHLQNIGLKTPFIMNEQSPPLSGMTDDKNSYISDVLHKARVEFTEDGTTASAATAVIVFTRSLQPALVVHMDRPFLFVIHERISGLALFTGRVDNPKPI